MRFLGTGLSDAGRNAAVTQRDTMAAELGCALAQLAIHA